MDGVEIQQLSLTNIYLIILEMDYAWMRRLLVTRFLISCAKCYV